ncbi:MAG: hypothetical protein JW731_12715 [Bacteroidales bacterium]|nr:hypothetical protein [Bacteroidales bacterium]
MHIILDLKDLLFDSSRKTADIAVCLVGDNPETFKKVLDFAMEDNGQFAMRAARVVNLAALNHPELMQPYINDIVKRLPGFKNDGLKRGIAKTLSERSFELEENTLGILVDTCFQWLNDPQEKIALKVYSMDILYRVSQSYPDIKPELISSLENELPKSSEAVGNRSKKILKKLYSEII